MKKVFTFILALAMAATLFAGCAKTTADDTPDAGQVSEGSAVLTVALPAAPAYLDPHIQAGTDSYRVVTQIFDRLVELDSDMNLVPTLAESWDVVDELTTVFHLRQGVKFQDGNEMTAEDVKYSLERCIASPGVNYNYLIIDEINIIDDYTVEIKTSAPCNVLLYRLTLDAASIVSKAAAESGEDFNLNPVGCGPFKLNSWDTTSGDVVLDAFEDYWAGKSEIDQVIFKTIPESINRTVALETGEADIAYDLSATDFKAVESNDKLKLEKKASTTVWYLGMNTKDEILSNKLVRKAIATAINIDDFIAMAFNGNADSAHNTMMIPYLPGYAPDLVKYDYNVDDAKALLAEAGYPDGCNLSLYVADSQIYKDASVVIQEALRQIGITVEIKSMDYASYSSATSNGEHQLFFFGKTSIDSDSMLRSMYSEDALGASGNRSFWTDAKVDEMLDEALSTTDSAHAEELYKEIQQIVADEVPVYPLCQDYINAGMSISVENFKLYPGKTHYIYGTTITK